MSLERQNGASREVLSEPQVSSAGSGESLPEFQVTDFIVYPAHGVGQILSIESQTVAGASLEFFVLYFAKSKMTVRVPVRKAASVGMRRPSSRSVVQAAKRVLGEAPRKGRGNWSRLAQEYEGNIKSGDIIAVAGVVRDLFRVAEAAQSFSERQLFASALDRLSGEVALVDEVSQARASAELEDLLKTSTLNRRV